MTVASATPWRDVIHRWNLEKKNPNEKLSEPVQPITFWMENTTPVEFRPIIKEAVERWNVAYEAAGFKNAVVCLQQPDDATWDAGDIRYNVLRWTSTPAPPFGGYGPSFVNPRTGEILGADIMLEWVALTNRVYADRTFRLSNSLTEEQEQLLKEKGARNPFLCNAAAMSNEQLIFGTNAANVMGASDLEKQEIVRQMLYRLVLHEVGHTLGLTHNMRASTLQSVADIKNVEKINKEGLANSVMEYPAFNYQMNPKEQALYCDVKVGPYDKWVIEYGYSTALSDEQKEKERLDKITARSTEHQLAYGNDADDMRGSFSGIDPRVNVNDLSGDAISYGIERMQLSLDLMGKIKGKYTKPNQSYQELKQAHNVLINEYFQQANVIVKYIGGVYVNRAFVGQPGEGKAYIPVAIADQKRAMKALSDYAFAANSFGFQSNLYPYLQSQRRGFGFFSSTEDPKINERILAFQTTILSHLSNPIVLKRMSNTRLYGNTYSVLNMFTDLTNAIIRGDNGPVPTQRFNLQDAYVDMLIGIVKGNNYDAVSQAAALSQLKTIERIAISGNEEAKAQSILLNQKIKVGLEK
jgi:hypothetical protein